MTEGSGGSYACRCPLCGQSSQRDHGEPPQLCDECRRAGVDAARVLQWAADGTLPVRRFDGTVR